MKKYRKCPALILLGRAQKPRTLGTNGLKQKYVNKY